MNKEKENGLMKKMKINISWTVIINSEKMTKI